MLCTRYVCLCVCVHACVHTCRCFEFIPLQLPTTVSFKCGKYLHCNLLVSYFLRGNTLRFEGVEPLCNILHNLFPVISFTNTLCIYMFLVFVGRPHWRGNKIPWSQSSYPLGSTHRNSYCLTLISCTVLCVILFFLRFSAGRSNQ